MVRISTFKVLAFIIMLCLACPAGAVANDSIASVTQDGIHFEKTDAVRMKKEVLSITPKQVVVDYEFENNSDQPVTTTVAFPLPPIGMNVYDNSERLEDFAVRVDGKTAAYQTRHTARLEGKDITQDLTTLSMPLDHFPDSKKLQPALLNELVKRHYYSTDNADEEMNADYMLQTTYYWQQTFPPHQTVRISHSYTPRLGGNSIGAVSNEEKWAPVVQNLESIRDECSISKEEKVYVCHSRYGVGYLNYILTTGSNWKEGVEDFTLRIEGASLVLAEIEGVPKAGVGKLEIKQKNFHPAKELLVEFIGIGQPPKLPPSLKLVQ